MLFRRLGVVAFVLCAGLSTAQEKPAAPAAKADDPSHKLTGSIAVKPAAGMGTATQPAALQTLCLDTDGRVLGLVAAPKPWGAPLKGATAEVHVFDPAGKPVNNYAVSFHGQAINCGPDGTVFVAGDGKVAKFDKAGKPVGAVVELPHIADLLKDQDELKKKAAAQLEVEKKQYSESITNAKKQFSEQLKKLEEKKAEDRTKTETRQIEQYKSLLKQYESMEAERKGRTVETVLGEMVGRVRVINAVAVSAKDVFVVCGDVGSYGYAVWRMNHDLTEPKRVLGEVRGCCGQMDIQVYGNDLLVAENCNYQFARYDREGKKVGGWGKRPTNPGQADGGDTACFGGCCNPMNVRAQSPTGDIFTAESEGVIKRYSPSGEFLGTAAKVKLTGGCKNVAIGVSADGKTLYFCDQPGSKFHIFVKQ